MFKLLLKSNEWWASRQYDVRETVKVGWYYVEVLLSTEGDWVVWFGVDDIPVRRFVLECDQGWPEIGDMFNDQFPVYSHQAPHPLVQYVDWDVPSSVREDMRTFQRDQLKRLPYDVGVDGIYGHIPNDHLEDTEPVNVSDIFWRWGG